MYKVIKDFTDLRDNRHVYRVGDEYPHSGISEVSENRIKELSGDQNTHGEPVIEEIQVTSVAPKKKERKKNVGADSGIYT